jgi:hypothetical protein
MLRLVLRMLYSAVLIFVDAPMVPTEVHRGDRFEYDPSWSGIHILILLYGPALVSLYGVLLIRVDEVSFPWEGSDCLAFLLCF